MRILVVEDDGPMAAALKRGLEEEHHTVTTAPDGDSGLALAQTYEFDVVVLDVMLPRVMGFEVPAARITSADRIELLSVVQMQIDNIQRELDTQMHRSGRLEIHLKRVEGKLGELIGLSKWLQDDGGSRPTPAPGFPRKIPN
jgi:CheY-like chemotaxis protein